MKTSGIDMDTMYRDQAMIYEEWSPERTFFAAYTPDGIHLLDGRYTRRIVHLNEDPQKLRVVLKERSRT